MIDKSIGPTSGRTRDVGIQLFQRMSLPRNEFLVSFIFVTAGWVVYMLPSTNESDKHPQA